jgi:transcriptional regulator with XRE-family HTH domain
MTVNKELPSFLEDVSPWELRFSRKYRVELVHRMNEVLQERGLSQKELAHRAGWKEPFVSRLLGGDQNLTLKTVARFEEAADADVLVIPLPADDSKGEP